jgi:DNA primase
MRAADIAHVLGGRRSGRGYVARCPIHHDRKPSLSVCDGAWIVSPLLQWLRSL